MDVYIQANHSKTENQTEKVVNAPSDGFSGTTNIIFAAFEVTSLYWYSVAMQFWHQPRGIVLEN